jgi:hypothetical protein
VVGAQDTDGGEEMRLKKVMMLVGVRLTLTMKQHQIVIVLEHDRELK